MLNSALNIQGANNSYLQK